MCLTILPIKLSNIYCVLLNANRYVVAYSTFHQLFLYLKKTINFKSKIFVSIFYIGKFL